MRLIPVSESLPEKCMEVLVRVDHGSMQTVRYCACHRKFNAYCLSTEEHRAATAFNHVTHWLSLRELALANGLADFEEETQPSL
jgi:hypothetical protein